MEKVKVLEEKIKSDRIKNEGLPGIGLDRLPTPHTLAFGMVCEQLPQFWREALSKQIVGCPNVFTENRYLVEATQIEQFTNKNSSYGSYHEMSQNYDKKRNYSEIQKEKAESNHKKVFESAEVHKRKADREQMFAK